MAPESLQETVTIERDRLINLLADEGRRHVLAVLRDTDEPLSVADLANSLARREAGDAKQRKITLHHRHLPKLADADLVEYDDETKAVTLTASSDEMETVTEVLALRDE